MTLKSEIGNGYIDSNGLVSSIKNADTQNGVCYTGEFLRLMEANDEMRLMTAVSWEIQLRRCMPTTGLLQRTPLNQGGLEGPDDYYGLAVAASVLDRAHGKCTIANEVLRYGLKHLGFFNNLEPGRIRPLAAFLWRQPQLIGAFLAAANKPTWLSKAAYKIIGQPFFLCAALSVLVAGRHSFKDYDTDPWRLTWLLIQAVAPVSWMVRLTARGWYKRLYLETGNRGMWWVAYHYYGPEHPFTKYWKDGYFGRTMP